MLVSVEEERVCRMLARMSSRGLVMRGRAGGSAGGCTEGTEKFPLFIMCPFYSPLKLLIKNARRINKPKMDKVENCKPLVL